MNIETKVTLDLDGVGHESGWTLLMRHGLVLACITQYPGRGTAEIAKRRGLGGRRTGRVSEGRPEEFIPPAIGSEPDELGSYEPSDASSRNRGSGLLLPRILFTEPLKAIRLSFEWMLVTTSVERPQ